MLTHPDVAECAVVGMPHPRWGEAGIAAVVAKPGAAALDEAAVLAHLQDRLARYKHPLRVVVWNELPRSGYGKVPKAMVRERLEAEGIGF